MDDDVHLTVTTDDRRNLSFLASEYADEKGTNLSHAYALTIYSSQGVTVDGNTFVFYNGRMGRADTYVAASRHKDHAHIFSNSKEIDEYTDLASADKVTNEQERLKTLAVLMTQENSSTLAIEHLLDTNKSVELGKDVELRACAL